MNNRCGIYKIISPSGKFYIGSAVKVSRRWWNHRYQLKKGVHHNASLQRAANKYGEGALRYEVLFYCDPSDVLMYEQRAIDILEPEYNIVRSAGSPLGFRHTDEAKAKIAAASRAQSEETREKRRASLRAAGFTDERRAKISAGLKGRLISDETRANMSAAKKGVKFSDERRANLARLRNKKGVPRPPEVIAKSVATRAINKAKKLEQLQPDLFVLEKLEDYVEAE
jgi:group I intron endonuclease